MNIKRVIILTLIFIIYSFSICYAQDINVGLEKLDIAGNKLMDLVTGIGRWVMIIMCAMECIKCGFNHNRSGVGNALITYSMIYGALFFIVYMMDIIEDVFQ